MNINALRQAQDRIAEAIKALKKTRNEHEEYLKPIETRTRQLLIDPMLEALGWDVRNPAQVHLEYKGTSGKPDYALLSHGNVVALIEAKKLKIPLASIKVEQVIKYARDKALTSLKYVVWTNGDHWQIWSIEEDREESFQLSNTQEYECAAKVIQLLRSALEVQEESPTPKPSAESPPTISEPSSENEVVDPSNNGDWVPLTSLKTEKGQKPPAFIKFPDSSPKPNKKWITLLETIVEHLIETDKLSARDCPVPLLTRTGKSERYLIHTKPIHASGNEFTQKREIGNGLWLFLGLGLGRIPMNACSLLEKSGIDPSTVLVSTNQS